MACTAWGMKISLMKTVDIYQPADNVPCQEASICVYCNKLRAIKKFLYLGSTLNMTGTFNDEARLRVSKVSDAFGNYRRDFRVGMRFLWVQEVHFTTVLQPQLVLNLFLISYQF